MNTKFNKQVILIDDDVQCIKLLTDMNLLGHLEVKPPGNTVWGFFSNRTHIGVALHCEGFDNDIYNGYVVAMVPLSAGSREEISQFLYDTFEPLIGRIHSIESIIRQEVSVN